jgi:hypothetical protein
VIDERKEIRWDNIRGVSELLTEFSLWLSYLILSIITAHIDLPQNLTSPGIPSWDCRPAALSAHLACIHRSP